MKIGNFVDTEAVFSGFSIDQSVQLPDQLQLHATGFYSDQEHLYGFRRSIQNDTIPGNNISSLYNGNLKANGKPSALQATEGHGLYIANHMDATKVPGIKGDVAYGIRVDISNAQILDSLTQEQLTKSQRIAAALHRIRSVTPGMPNPGTKGWDKLYGEAEVITFAPMALARLCIGRSVSIGNISFPPRWALIRNPENTTIIAKKRN